MKLSELKTQKDAGVINGFEVVHDPQYAGWILIALGSYGGRWTFQDDQGIDRVFASLDTLIDIVEFISGKAVTFRILI